MNRVLSSQFPDDNSVYHHHDEDRIEAGVWSGADEYDTSESSESEKTSGEVEEADKTKEGADDELDEEEIEEFGSDEHGTTIEGIKGGIPYEEDIEENPARLEKKKSSQSIKDPNLVTWDGPDDPKNPKNWSMRRKWAATFIVSSFTLVSPISSSMISPALYSISDEFHITQNVEASLTLSIFVLAYAIGPLFLGPLSEIYGRVVVLQLSNLFYLAWNLGCGFAQNKAQLMVFRFFSGLGGSAPLAIGGVSGPSCPLSLLTDISSGRSQ